MECKSCGSSLALEQEYCPYCGTRNEAAAHHIEDMRYYNRAFTQTQQRVLKESKWYSRYLAVMLAIVMAAVANVAVIVIEQEACNIQYYMNKWYHQRHGREIVAMLRKWEKNGDYARIGLYYDETGFAGLEEAEEFIPVISAYRDMEKLKAYLIQVSLASVTENRRRYSYDSYEIEGAAGCIIDLYQIFTQKSYSWYDDAFEGIHQENLQKMEETVELWLKTYLYFTDEDVEEISHMQKYEVLSLIDRRSPQHD